MGGRAARRFRRSANIFLAVHHLRRDRQQHLHESFVAGLALDLLDAKLRILRGHHDGRAQPRIARHPFLLDPVVGRAAYRGTIVGLTTAWPPYSGLQIAKRVSNASSACDCKSAISVPGLPFGGRQSGRHEIGAPGG